MVQTAFIRTLSGLARSARFAAADDLLANTTQSIRRPDDLHYGRRIADAVAAATYIANATTDDLLAAIGDLGNVHTDQRFTSDEARLSDTLLARTYSRNAPELNVRQLQNLFRAYELVASPRDGHRVRPLSAYLALPLLLPINPALPAPPPEIGEPTHEAASKHVSRRRTNASTEVERIAALTAAELHAAVRELTALDHGANLMRPSGDGGRAFVLTAQAQRRLSSATRRVLDQFGIDLDVAPVHAAVGLLERAGDRVAPAQPMARFKLLDPSAAVSPQGPTLRAAGLAHLLVVKQQIKRYEASEIAHVENILAGEKRSRTHREYRRTEETITTQVETTVEEENELQTTDRFELNRETSRTIQQDLSVGFGLSLSGKYGPTIEFTSDATLESSQQTQESIRNATTYSKDVVQRSLQRVSERVLQERIQRIIREAEETNLHELNNPAAEHRSGIYQFLDKIYEAQVFDYGIREMLDFMIPEPASFLWYVDSIPETEPVLPDPPQPLDSQVMSAAGIKEDTYQNIAALYGATDIEAPPKAYQTVIGALEHGVDDASEEGRPRSKGKIELTIPEGYQAWRATIDVIAVSDADPVVVVSAGGHRELFKPHSNARIDLSGKETLAALPLFFDFSEDGVEPTPESKVTFEVIAYETNTYTLNASLIVRRTDQKLQNWRLSTYAKIRAAYDARLQDYTQKVVDLKAQAAADARAQQNENPYGAPPSQNKQTIRTELKKQCLAVITQQWFDGFNAVQTTNPPVFNFAVAAAQGSFIRFFEQAYEWDQLQYVCYPYFWSRQSMWIDRFRRDDTDPEFREFWRAGAARVVVPVRPGFEVAVTYYLQTGKIWNGEGEPPDVWSPMYLSIVDEIRERAGAPAAEIPVGNPWQVRLPTSLVLVRKSPDLPTWERIDPEEWKWQPVIPQDDG
jgi:hypothetical protein